MQTTSNEAGFDECTPTHEGVYVLESEGVYLLTVKPTEAREGRALVSGLNNNTSSCNSKSRVAAVKFRLVSLKENLSTELSDLAANVKADNSTANRTRQVHLLRNRVAHRCFGTGDPRLNSFISDPFGATATTYGLLDDLRPNTLTDCEVPLAVLYWTRAGVQFVDTWAVRRRVTAPTPTGFGWPLLADRRRAEGEAMFWQFQAQLANWLKNTTTETAIARTEFDYFPAVGLLPIGGMKFQRGLDYATFFSGKTYRNPVYIEGAQMTSLIHESLLYPPINLKSDEMVWLYLARENIELIDHSAFRAPQGYMIFATGHMPFRGGARFDVNRWDYANSL